VLETVQALTNLSEIDAVDARPNAVRARMAHGVDGLLEFDASWVVEMTKFPLGVFDAAGELGVLGEPSVTEPGTCVEFRDTALGLGDPAVELVEGWLRLRNPVVLGQLLGPGG
jgi:hypothetical protein